MARLHPDADADPACRFAQAYEELCRIARGNRFVGTSVDAMQARALVHETFLCLQRRLGEQPSLLEVALAMRGVARDRWRAKTAAKRGGAPPPLSLDEQRLAASTDTDPVGRLQVLELYEVMNRLHTRHPRWFAVIVHRYFEGRTVDETGALLGIGAIRVRRERRRALSWLRRELDPGSRAASTRR